MSVRKWSPPRSYERPQAASFWGHHRYSSAYPNLRWAGQGGINSAGLTVTESEFVITPLKLFRTVLRMPEVRIPISAVEMAWEIHWGVKFVTPSRPDLNGTSFKSNNADGGRQLVALVKKLGIPVQTMPWRDRVSGFFRDSRTQHAGGRRWLKQTLRNAKAAVARRSGRKRGNGLG
jgi:hypothetical protein